ncbi:hypothetical protein RQP46_004446 [Phenoliferia psychrophenolica]
MPVPAGYVAINDEPTELWSVAAEKRSKELLVEADERDPDQFDMYIYNDFLPYALENLVEEELKTFAAQLKKAPTAKTTFETLEGLLLFTCAESGFLMAADGERVSALVGAFAAAFHTMASSLHTASPSLLTPTYIPNIENVLRTAIMMLTDFRSMCDSDVLSGTVDSLKVLLCIEGLEWKEKKSLILGQQGEDEDGEDEVETHDKKTKKRKVDPDQEIKDLASLGFAKAEKTLGHKVTAFRFSTIWNKYKKVDGYGLQEFKYGQGWNIKNWTEDLKKKERERFNDIGNF